MADKRKEKRWKREHRKKDNGGVRATPLNEFADGQNVRVVYRPKTSAEAERRVGRSKALMGTPFISLPGITDHKQILFTAKNGTPVPAEAVEMMFNDALLMDALSNWGEDGPLYADTLESDLEKEVYGYALMAYAGVEIPSQLKKPE